MHIEENILSVPKKTMIESPNTTLITGGNYTMNSFRSYTDSIHINGNVVDELDCGGIILFAEAGRQECISITIDDEEAHTGIVHSKKLESVNSGTRMTVYLVIQEFNGHKVPLQIFEVYDLTKSSNIPDYFMVSICSATTGEVIQSQSFHKISRIR